MPKNHRKALITNRPFLAFSLMSEDCRIKSIENPKQADDTVWLFEVSDKSYQIVKRYYQERRLSMPIKYKRAYAEYFSTTQGE